MDIASPDPARAARRMWMLQVYLTWCVQTTLRTIRQGRELALVSTRERTMASCYYGTTGLCRCITLVLCSFPRAKLEGIRVLRSWVCFTMSSRALWLALRITNIDGRRKSRGQRPLFVCLPQPPPSTPFPSTTAASSSSDPPGTSPPVYGPHPRAGPPRAVRPDDLPAVHDDDQVAALADEGRRVRCRSEPVQDGTSR